MSTTELEPITSHVKTDEEFHEDFRQLHSEEVERAGKLDQTIFAMGDLLVRWNPDKATIRQLAREFGYTPETLEARRETAHEIPASIRNPRLSYSAHREALKIQNPDARTKLIADMSDATQQQVRVAVMEKRVELGEVKPPKRPKVAVLEQDKMLSWSAGFAVSDGTSVARGRVTFVEGELQIVVDGSAPFSDEPDTAVVKRGKQLILSAASQQDNA